MRDVEAASGREVRLDETNIVKGRISAEEKICRVLAIDYALNVQDNLWRA